MDQATYRALKGLHDKAYEASEITADTWHLGTMLLNIWVQLSVISQQLESEE